MRSDNGITEKMNRKVNTGESLFLCHLFEKQLSQKISAPPEFSPTFSAKGRWRGVEEARKKKEDSHTHT